VEQLTRTELIARADLICRRVNEKRASTTLGSRQAYARLLPQIAAYERAAAAEMRTLTPPASMAKSWKRIVAGIQAVADETSILGEYAIANKLAQADAGSVVAVKTMRRTRTLAGREGFKDCARAS
jgi:hypothetical protein